MKNIYNIYFSLIGLTKKKIYLYIQKEKKNIYT